MNGQELSIVHLVAQASFFVKAIMGILLLLSLVSWWQIFIKWLHLGETRKSVHAFETRFWGGADVNNLYRETASKGEAATGLEVLFTAGFSEFSKLRKQGIVGLPDMMASSRRAMVAASQRELDRLEDSLSFLGTVGSVSPYIGLLGTVWGIMSAFQGLAHAGQATLAQVAPGIAEALVATAIGLFAAIPAVMAYNRYTNQVDRLASRFDTFIDEFSNLLVRQGAAR